MTKTDSEFLESGIVEEHVEKKSNPLSILRNWDFSALFFGGFINNIGSYFTSIAIIFLALEVTSSLPVNEATREIALMTTFTLAPMLLLGPLAGVLVDKFDRKKILVLGDSLGAILALGLIFSSQMWHLYLFAVMNSSVRQFFYPAKTASIPLIVKQDKLLTANGFIQTSSNLSRLIGPLIAGFVAGTFGFDIAFIIDSISYAASAVLIFTIKKDLRPPKKEESVTFRSVFSGLKEGFVLSFGDKIIAFVIILFSFTILMIGMVDPLFIPFMNFEFGMGEREFGLIMSFSAISGIITAVALSIKGQLKNKLTFMSATILVASFCVTFLALAPFLPGKGIWLYVGMALVGMINVGFNIPFSTLLQKTIRNEHLGKISGVVDTVITGASLLASTIAAALAGVIHTSYIFMMIAGMIAVAGIIGLVVIKVMNLEQLTLKREEEMTLILDKYKKEDSPALKDIRESEITLDQLDVEELPSPQPSFD